MADVFLSYAREDAVRVARLAAVLKAAGLTVWWDQNLAGGARYLKETEAELKSARAVVVVWSSHSIDSHWVADEAMVGRDETRLVPITIDGSTPPLGFRQFQTIDFTGWKGGDDACTAKLVSAVGGPGSGKRRSGAGARLDTVARASSDRDRRHCACRHALHAVFAKAGRRCCANRNHLRRPAIRCVRR